jgi:acetyl-CoA carboxylase biotin carboxyl carrier protein
MARAIAEIEALLAAMERHGIERIELEDAEGCLSLALPPDTTPAAIPVAGTRPSGAPEEDRGSLAKATIAGRFLPTHPWRAKPLAEIGRHVTAGEIVGLVQVGFLYVPVTAPADGVIDAILAEPGALVGYGSPLLRLDA